MFRSMSRFLSLAAAAAVLLAAAGPAAAVTYTGKIEGGDVIVDPSGTSWDGETSLEWTVTQLAPVNGIVQWNYVYAFISPDPELSNIIIELTRDVLVGALGDIEINGVTPTDPDAVEVDEYTKAGNLNLPGELYGVKFNIDPQALATTISFTIANAPVWGDFAAKGADLLAYNSGFLAPDPNDAPSDGVKYTMFNGVEVAHILRPNGIHTQVVPEPSTYALALTGLAAAGVMGLRRRRS